MNDFLLHNKKIPVFFASDENYAPYLCAALYSLLLHTKSSIQLYILDGGISNESKQKITASLASFSHFSLEYISTASFDLQSFPNVQHFSVNSFSRYYIAKLKPEINKAIYLDADIILKGDITELFDIALPPYPLAAMPQNFMDTGEQFKKEIYPEYKGGKNYFNSGVLVMDLDYFRKNNISQTLIDKTHELRNILRFPDQDVLNIVFENNFKILDYRFNFFPNCYHTLKKYYRQADRYNAVILHYICSKPWNEKTAGSKDFWEIAGHTAFYGSMKQRFDEMQKQQPHVIVKFIKGIPRKIKKIPQKTNLLLYKLLHYGK